MAVSKNVTIIAREGYGHIVLAFIPFAFAVYGNFFAFFTYLFFFLFIFTLYFFRNPERIVADDTKGSVLSPIDGVIEGIDRLENGSGVRVRIRNGMFDTHIVRAPFKSTVRGISRRHGMAVAGDREKALRLNGRCSVLFDEVSVDVVTTFFPYEMACYFVEDEGVRHGERIGFLYTGHMEMVLPNTINLHIDIGDRVKSAESLIGIIKE